MSSTKPIYSITPFTLLDYPEKTACILWFAGCNMKCLFCYNPHIVYGKGKVSIEEVMAFLATRKGLLDGVVFSGGECTLHPSVVEVARRIKQEGFLVKIDTNGSHPERIALLLEQNLLDYVALDFKSPVFKFKDITRSSLFNKFESTLELLLTKDIPFEIRTTYHQDLLNPADLLNMKNYLENKGYNRPYFIQPFVNNVPTLGNTGPSNPYTLFKIFDEEGIPVLIRD